MSDVHSDPVHQRNVSGVPAGSGYQPARGDVTGARLTRTAKAASDAASARGAILAGMISRELAALLARHLDWTPRNGDHFFIARDEIRESVFLVSDMVVELVQAHGQSRFHLNGTTEWALDSVEESAVVWLPSEEQLRDRLGEHFLSLDRNRAGFVVSLGGPGQAFHTSSELDASDAYARALLHVLGADVPAVAPGQTPVEVR